MPEYFFNIPLPNHPTLIEAQNYLRQTFGDKAVYTDPANFHITLVYVTDDNGADMSNIAFPAYLPVFGVSAHWLGIFRTEKGISLHARLQHEAHLLILQGILFYAATGAGAKVSPMSYPGVYHPHITLATLTEELDEFVDLPSGVVVEVRRVGLSADGYQPVKEWSLLADVPVQEMRKELATRGRRFTLAEAAVPILQGSRKAPKISIPADINVEELKQALGVDTLVTATLPIGMPSRSRNGFRYGARSVSSLAKQVNTKRPEGRWGHLGDDEIGTTYEAPAVRWLAAQIDSKGTAWGLALALTPEARQHFLSASATNARIGTSIFGINPEEVDGETVNYDLWTIDLANAERVGIPETAERPVVTQETVKNIQKKNEDTMADENKTPEPSASIVLLEQDRTRLKDQNERLQAQVTEMRLMQEAAQSIRELLALPEKSDLVTAVRELKTTRDDLCNLLGDNPVKATRELKAAHEALIAENVALLDSALIAEVTNKVKIESARGVVAQLIRAEKPKTRTELDAAVNTVMDLPFVKELLKTKLVDEMGPGHGKPAKSVGKATINDYFANPEVLGKEQ